MESPSESELLSASDPAASGPGPGSCDPGEPPASRPSDAADASSEASPLPTPFPSSLSSSETGSTLLGYVLHSQHVQYV